MRHAKSSWENPSLSDFERPLNPRGIRATAIMGEYIRDNKLTPDFAICSSAKRTKETLNRMLPFFNDDLPIHHTKKLYEGSASEYLEEITSKGQSYKSILVIGHSPIIQVLALNLIQNTKSEDYARLSHHFPTAALAVIKLKLKSWSNLELRCGELSGYYLPRELEKT